MAKPKSKKKIKPPMVSFYRVTTKQPLPISLKVPSNITTNEDGSSPYEMFFLLEESPDLAWDVQIYVGDLKELPSSEEGWLGSFVTERTGAAHLRLTSTIHISLTSLEVSRLQKAQGNITIFAKSTPATENQALVLQKIELTSLQ